MTNQTSAELKRLAREYLTGNYAAVISAILFSFCVPAVLLSFFSGSVSFPLNLPAILSMIAAFIIFIIEQLFHISILRIHLLLAKRQQVLLKDIFWIFRSQPDRFILAVLLLCTLMVLPLLPAAFIFYITKIKSILNVFAMILLAAAIIFAELQIYYMYGLIYPLCIENPELTLLSAFHRSHSLMRGNKKKFFLLQFSFIGWILLGICSFGIGFLWILPYFTQTSVNFYLDIIKNQGGESRYFDISA